MVFKIIVEPGRTKMRSMAHAHCMLQIQGYKLMCGYTHTLPGYGILTAFPLQQWLHERGF
jgi:hypothetical protein